MANTCSYRKYAVLCCAIFINLQLGVSYSWSVFSKALVDLEGWAYSDAILPSTFASVSYSLSMLIFGFFQEKHGLRLTVMTGALLIGTGMIIAARFLSVPGVAIGYGILYGCGAGACFSATQAAALKWMAGDKQGIATGIISTAFGISSVIISMAATRLIALGGVSMAFYVIGLVTCPMLCLAGLFLRQPQQQPLSPVKLKEAAANAACEAEDMDCRAMMRTRAFFYLLGVYLFTSAAVMVPVGHISMIASMQGRLQNGYIYVGIISLCGCVGRLAGGYLCDRFSARTVLLVTGLLGLGNMCLFQTYTSSAALVCGCILVGWHFGALMTLTPLLTAKLFGKKHCAQNYGAICSFGIVSSLMGSQLAGYIVDTYQSYRYAYLLCCAYLAVAAFLIWRLPKDAARPHPAL